MTAALRFKFLLFVAGDTHNSTEARTRLTTLCEAHLSGNCDVEIVDVFLQPERALADGIFMTPTLVRLEPAPVRKIVGTLSNTEVVMSALGLNGFAG